MQLNHLRYLEIQGHDAFCQCFFLGIVSGSNSNIKVLNNPLWIDFCAWWETEIWVHLVSLCVCVRERERLSSFLRTTCWRGTHCYTSYSLFLCQRLAVHILKNLTEFSLLCHWSEHLSLPQYQTVLIIIALLHNYKLEKEKLICPLFRDSIPDT